MAGNGNGIRVRFAPSPTGRFHIGLARTALFNWLLARHCGGTFILRMEDTDRARSTERSTFSILGNLRWLGLDWDEGPGVGGEYGPYHQMQRLDIYSRCAQQLTESGHAFRCYCTREELEGQRKEAKRTGGTPGHDARCRELDEKDRERLESEGRTPVLRFRTPREGETRFKDLVRGKLTFQNQVLDDFVLTKSDGAPGFLFANVVDDHMMEITDVVRGDDHVSNTPRQVLLYRALGFTPPRFAHLPMILGSDGKKLSKREGARSLTWYRRRGFLPSAIINYLSLLGWSTSDSQQLFDSTDEIVEKFSLERVGKTAATFDMKKLEWMNGQHIRNLPVPQLRETLVPYMKRAGLPAEGADPAWMEEVLALAQQRLPTLSRIGEVIDFFFVEEVVFDPAAVEKVFKKEGAARILEQARGRLAGLEDFSAAGVEKACRDLIAELGIKGGQLTHPVRVAVTGRTTGPGLFELISVLGKDQVLRRIERALEMLPQ